MIVIDLSDYPNNTSICTLCCELIREDMDPNTVVNFVRNGIPVFTDVRPLKHWAKFRVAESSGDHWMRLVPYQLSVHVPQTQEKEFTHAQG